MRKTDSYVKNLLHKVNSIIDNASGTSQGNKTAELLKDAPRILQNNPTPKQIEAIESIIAKQAQG